jgi:heat shock protein HtpX
MVAALQRLKQNQDAPPMPDEMRAFSISAGKVQKMFSSHPPLDERIKVLQQG